MKVRNLLLVCLSALMISCGTASIPAQIPATMQAGCDLYTTSRPDIVKARDLVASNWDRIPEDAKPTLLRLNAVLPQLDATGQLLCAAAFSLESVSGSNVKWDEVLSTVLRGVSLAAELKARGVI